MKIIYQTKVTKIGEFAAAFSEEKMMIIFLDNAPEELADYCVLHSGNHVSSVIKAGDVLAFAGQEYKIIFVGKEVQTNLTNLGHITLRFTGTVAEGLEGSLYLEEKPMSEVKIDDEILIYSQE